MVNIEDLIKLQVEFDSNHSSTFKWDQKIDDENLDILQFLIISIIGELGETSNLVKKIIRGDFELDQIKEHLSEEVIDILIYVLKLAYQLDIDVEKEYLKKLSKNKIRFQNYSEK